MKYSKVQFKTLACIAGRHEQCSGFSSDEKCECGCHFRWGL